MSTVVSPPIGNKSREYGVEYASSNSALDARSVVTFFVLAIAISWATWAIPLAPTLGPMIAAVIVSLKAGGRAAVRDLISPISRWRVGLRWWLVAISPGLLMLLTLSASWLIGGDVPAAKDFGQVIETDAPILGIVVSMVILLVASVGEEVGWRGYALPQLQLRFTPLRATLVLATVWFLWHVQFFVTESSLPAAGYIPQFFIITCIAVTLTWLYNRSGGSLLLVIIWHALYNFVAATDTLVLIMTAAVVFQALLLVVFELHARHRGRSILARTGP